MSQEPSHCSRYCPPTHSRLGNDLLNPVPEEGSVALRACRKLSSEARELYLRDEVEEVHSVPSPTQFANTWLAGNRPLVLRGAVQHWPALQKWSMPYLRDKAGDSSVSVAVTPTGFADAPNDGFFVLPEERTMMFSQFLDVIEQPGSQSGVWYVQKQNNNLKEEFGELLNDLEPGSYGEVRWFSEALGKKPDAVNFWIGDSRAVTSMHKDHYENIYCVISGYKDFVLIPPTDAAWVPYKNYPLASYQYNPSEALENNIINQSKEASARKPLLKMLFDCQNDSIDHLDSQRAPLTELKTTKIENENRKTFLCEGFRIVPDEAGTTVPWIAIDPLAPDYESFPQYKEARAVRVRVHAGDSLYLPSMWFHHVTQSHACVAVNYWYDMDYGINYAHYKMLQSLTWTHDQDNEDDDE